VSRKQTFSGVPPGEGSFLARFAVSRYTPHIGKLKTPSRWGLGKEGHDHDPPIFRDHQPMTTEATIIPQRLKNTNLSTLNHTKGYVNYLREREKPVHERFKKRVQKTLNTVVITFQGELVKARCHSLIDRGETPGGTRAPIRKFSRAARKNMLEQVSRIDWEASQATFITLTYHEPVHDAKKCKAHLRALLKRLYRAYGDVAVLWRMDTQKRGCWHFHLLVFDLPYVPRQTKDGNGLLDWWRDITGQQTITQLDIQVIQSAKKARSYVAKYVGKVNEVAAYLDYLANLAVAILPGRFWGLENRKNIHWCEVTTWTILSGSEFSGYWDFKRAARSKWDGVNDSKWAGWTIFVENLANWERMFHLLVRAENGAKVRKGS